MNTGSSEGNKLLQRIFPRLHTGSLLPRITCIKEIALATNKTKPISEKKIKQLNVVLISTPFFGLPPPAYSGLESFVYNLAVELAKLGVHVTVVAPKGSDIPNVDIIETTEPAHDFSGFGREHDAFEIYKSELKDFDGIIHDHSWLGLVYQLKKNNQALKICKTCHGMVCWSSAMRDIKNINMISPSRMHAEHIKQTLHTDVKIIHHGIDIEQYPFKAEKGNHYLMLSRIVPEKGIDVFVDIIKRTDAKGDIIGEDVFADAEYVKSIKSQCDGSQIKYYRGREITKEEKVRFLQNAKALIALPMLSRGSIEAWGLNVTEALSCGTPVIGLKNGGNIEQIEDGKTGFLCDSVEEIKEIIKQNKVEEINPETCRESAEKRFSINTCAKSYIEQYTNILRGEEW